MSSALPRAAAACSITHIGERGNELVTCCLRSGTWIRVSLRSVYKYRDLASVCVLFSFKFLMWLSANSWRYQQEAVGERQIFTCKWSRKDHLTFQNTANEVIIKQCVCFNNFSKNNAISLKRNGPNPTPLSCLKNSDFNFMENCLDILVFKWHLNHTYFPSVKSQLNSLQRRTAERKFFNSLQRFIYFWWISLKFNVLPSQVEIKTFSCFESMVGEFVLQAKSEIRILTRSVGKRICLAWLSWHKLTLCELIMINNAHKEL